MFIASLRGVSFSNTCTFGIPYTGSGSLLVGLIQVLWSLLPLLEAGRASSLFMRVLNNAGAGEEWLGVMSISGVFLCVSSITLCRSVRHISLFISCAVLLSSFSLFVAADVITPVSVTLPLLGLYAMGLLILDVFMKNKRLTNVRRMG